MTVAGNAAAAAAVVAWGEGVGVGLGGGHGVSLCVRVARPQQATQGKSGSAASPSSTASRSQFVEFARRAVAGVDDAGVAEWYERAAGMSVAAVSGVGGGGAGGTAAAIPPVRAQCATRRCWGATHIIACVCVCVGCVRRRSLGGHGRGRARHGIARARFCHGSAVHGCVRAVPGGHICCVCSVWCPASTGRGCVCGDAGHRAE